MVSLQNFNAHQMATLLIGILQVLYSDKSDFYVF